ncbi:hypothetical protein [Cryptosporangium arvum]|uniref:hypothetical protein n=1 Tax=Cryptosporangium arvum TaxID=80871 RepID=UPI0004B66421|nr:hypothetical protein [Cryptosporangium arvum]
MGLDAVPWNRLHHAYGSATDVPGHLRSLRSSDPDVRQNACAALLGTVYHHGTRWQATRYVVQFVVGLVEARDTPDRAVLIGLLRALSVGDREDGELPFSSAAAFAAASGVTSETERTVLTWLYDEETRPDEAQLAATDAVAAYWAQAAYEAGARHGYRYLNWLSDPDPAVAAGAAELLVWFPETPGIVPSLLAVPADDAHALARSSANLSLGHLARSAEGGNVEIDSRLVDLLGAPHVTVSLTAAVALAYRHGTSLPPGALQVLQNARNHKVGRREWADSWPWDRPPAAFAELALRRATR